MKRKKKEDSIADNISGLLELAEKLHLPDGAFDDEIDDESYYQAKLQAENVKSVCLMEQLEYLHSCGFAFERLGQLIKEYAPKKNEKGK